MTWARRAMALPFSPGLDWKEVGTPPAETQRFATARFARFRRIFGPVSSLGFAVVMGVVVWEVLAPDSGWGFDIQVAAALVVAALAGIGTYFFFGGYGAMIQKAGSMEARRIAWSDGTLHVELPTGQTFTRELAKVGLADTPAPGGWYSMTLSSGRFFAVFYLPPEVAEGLKAALQPVRR
jgi:hypothetical protein